MISEKWKTTLFQMLSRKMVVSLLMGFSCGIPYSLVRDLLKARMTEQGVDLTVIGFMGLILIPYSLKMFWAPFMDYYVLPFFGRRRGWLFVSQVGLMGAIAVIGQIDPAEHLGFIAVSAFLMTFFSASQDTVVDAYRREDLTDNELGLGSSLYIYGYRIGMLISISGGLILADRMPYSSVYLLMAAFVVIGIITTLLSPEPEIDDIPPQSIKEAVIDPLLEYFSRKGALLILVFILFYKVGDNMASAMTIPFYLEIGFTKTQVGAVAKLFGFWATLAGAMSGGILMLRLGIHKSLWVFGILQAISTAGFAVLSRIGDSIPALSFVIAFENLSSGMGTAAFVAFMASITNKKYTATQYALLTSLMGVPRDIVSSSAGVIAKHLGWEAFFIFSTLLAIPGMMLLYKIAPWNGFKNK